VPRPLRAIANPVERVQRASRALEAAVRALPGGARNGRKPPAPMLLAGALLALAFPDRIGQRREGSEGRYLLANGRGAAFAGAVSLAREEFIVALELDDREREARIDLAAPLSRALLEQLFESRIVTEERFGWEMRSGAVVARRVRQLDALMLEDVQRPAADDVRAVAAMLEGVRQCGIEALPWDADSRSLQARMQFVRSLQRRDLADWPASDAAALTASLEQWLAPYLGGITRRDQLARIALSEALAQPPEWYAATRTRDARAARTAGAERFRASASTTPTPVPRAFRCDCRKSSG